MDASWLHSSVYRLAGM